MTEDLIKARAYEIWQREGQVDGRALDHWLQAQAELTAAHRAETETAAPASSSPAAETIEAKPKRTVRRRKAAAPKGDQPAASATTAGTKATKPRTPRARKARVEKTDQPSA